MADAPVESIWFKLMVNDLLGRTMHWGFEEHGIYLLLRSAYWKRQGPLPADDEMLRRITRTTAQQWKKFKPQVAPFFVETNGHWTDPWMDEEIRISTDIQIRNRENGRAGGLRSAELKRQATAQPPLEPTSSDRSTPAQPPLNPALTERSSKRSTQSQSQSQSQRKRSDAPIESSGKTPSPSTPPGPQNSTNSQRHHLRNHPDFPTVLAYVRKQAPEFTETNVRSAWNFFEAGAVNGEWMWDKRPVTDWRAAIERQLSFDSERRPKKNGGTPNRTMAALFATETLDPADMPK